MGMLSGDLHCWGEALKGILYSIIDKISWPFASFKDVRKYFTRPARGTLAYLFVSRAHLISRLVLDGYSILLVKGAVRKFILETSFD